MELKQIEKRLNYNFAAIQGFYWSAYCSCCSFASVFLLSKNFDNSQIGMVLALPSIIAVFLQPMVAAYADRCGKITLKQMMAVICLFAMVLSAFLLMAPDTFMMLAVLLVLILTAVVVVQPLVNSLHFEFVNRGIDINFGITRGIGSISYAVLSYILGVLIQRNGPGMIPYVSLFVITGLTLSILAVKDSRKLSFAGMKEEKQRGQGETQGRGGIEFFKAYQGFFGYLCGIFLIFIFQVMFTNYLVHVVDNVGGTSSQMGIAIFIAAILELPVMAVINKLIKRLKLHKLLYCASVFFIIKAAGAYIAVNMTMIYIDQMLQMFSYAVMIPASVYYVNCIMKEKDRVKGQAFTTMAMTAGGVLGSLMGGWLIDEMGVKAMLAAGIFVTAAGTLLIIGFTEKKERSGKL